MHGSTTYYRSSIVVARMSWSIGHWLPAMWYGVRCSSARWLEYVASGLFIFFNWVFWLWTSRLIQLIGSHLVFSGFLQLS